MVTLTCSRCGRIVANVRDTRFGIAPAGSLCLSCSTPAYTRRFARVY